MNWKQIDCFKMNMAYWKFLGLWPGENCLRLYQYYSKICFIFLAINYNIVTAVNFFYIPKQLDLFVEEMLFYFTELAIISKAMTFYFKLDKMKEMMDILECDIFQPKSADGLKIVRDAKKLIKRYCKTVTVVSYLSNLSHVLSPLFAHIFLHISLALPVCSYSFIPENVKEMLIYPLYTYQSIGMHFLMLISVNTDTFILGLMILTVAQLEVLNFDLRRLTDNDESTDNMFEKEQVFKDKLHKCLIHFEEIQKFVSLIEDVFSMLFFVQFSTSSCILCVVLFRFTLPAATSYYIFLITYTVAMLVPVLMPTWFGTRIMESTSSLSVAIYNCDWISRPRQFKTSVILFAERMKIPLSITGWKMFPLSLTTFTKIMNSAYSFFTLLRNMQTLDP